MPLTDTAVKKAKPGDKPVKLSDAKGLYLLVNPVGSKLWRWKYRVLGKEKVMALGRVSRLPCQSPGVCRYENSSTFLFVPNFGI